MVCVSVVVWTSVHLSSFVCQCAFVFVFICGGVCRYAFFLAWAMDKQRLTKCLQINGIHNSIEKKELSEGRQCVSNADPRGDRVPTQEKEKEEEKGEKESEEKEATSLMKKRINPPLLKLELKKAYEFSPGSGLLGGNLPCARYQKSYMLLFLFF